jgi:TnpA family transposase
VSFSSIGKVTCATAASRTTSPRKRLNLIVAAIILWNTVYLERAVAALREHGIAIEDQFLAHLSPTGWRNGPSQPSNQ